LYPVPEAAIRDIVARYPETADLVWLQEEPKNMGAWRFVETKWRSALDGRRLRYIGRPDSASPSTGALKRHLAEQAEFLAEAFSAEIVQRPKRPKKLVKRRKQA
jgi:2-oxoglutarate dehydrogenase complex dehydrogenase (E1) component-like enzyme